MNLSPEDIVDIEACLHAIGVAVTGTPMERLVVAKIAQIGVVIKDAYEKPSGAITIRGASMGLNHPFGHSNAAPKPESKKKKGR